MNSQLFIMTLFYIAIEENSLYTQLWIIHIDTHVAFGPFEVVLMLNYVIYITVNALIFIDNTQFNLFYYFGGYIFSTNFCSALN